MVLRTNKLEFHAQIGHVILALLNILSNKEYVPSCPGAYIKQFGRICFDFVFSSQLGIS